MPRHLGLATIVVLSALVGTATADVSLIVEAHRGPRPPDAEGFLQPVVAELRRRGFLGENALASHIETSVSRSPGRLSASQLADAQKALDDGYRHFIEGEYEAAVTTTEKALALYASAPGQLAREAPLRDLQFKAFLICARSYEASNRNEDAFRVMAEQIRTFPDRMISSAEWDPRVGRLQRRVRTELKTQGTGTLEVKVDDPSVVVFLNEHFVATGPTRLDSLLPGRYRVHFAKGDQPGRVHEVQVNPGEEATVSVTWPLERALRTTSTYVGLELPRDADITQELAAAIRLGRELRAKKVVVLSLRAIDRRRAVIGYAVQTESQTKVFAAVQVEPVEPAAATLIRLGALLAGEKRVDMTGIVTRDLISDPAPLAERPRTSRSSSGWYTDGFGWALTATGLALTGASAGFFWSADSLRRDANDDHRQNVRQDLRDRADTRTWIGVGCSVAGAAAIFAGVIKLAWSDGSGPETSTWQSRTHLSIGPSSIGLAGSF